MLPNRSVDQRHTEQCSGEEQVGCHQAEDCKIFQLFLSDSAQRVAAGTCHTSCLLCANKVAEQVAVTGNGDLETEWSIIGRRTNHSTNARSPQGWILACSHVCGSLASVSQFLLCLSGLLVCSLFNNNKKKSSELMLILLGTLAHKVYGAWSILFMWTLEDLSVLNQAEQ